MKRRNFITSGLLSLPLLSAIPSQTKALKNAAKDFSDLKVTAVKAYEFDRATFVKIETNANISGWGEADHDYPDIIEDVIEKICAWEVVGNNPFDSEYLWNRMYFKGFDAGSAGLLPGAIAGVDNALWDLKGKLLNLPVHKILGGHPVEKIKVYGSFGRGKGSGYKTADEMAEEALSLVEQGYQVIKPRMQIRQLNINPDPDTTLEVIKTIRKAVGDGITIYVDFNNGYTPAKAIVMIKKLIEHCNIAAIEEPTSQQNYNGLRQVVDAVDIPVMAGEHEYNKWQMRDLITVANIDTINADVIKCAGITECKKVADMAHAFDKRIMVHNTRPTLATAASLQLISSIPNAARIQEYAGERPYMNLGGLFENKFNFKDGYLYLNNDLPGLGLIVNEKEMEKRKKN